MSSRPLVSFAVISPLPLRFDTLSSLPVFKASEDQAFYLHFQACFLLSAAAKSLSRVRLCATPQTAAHQAPPSMGFSKQEYWSGVPLPSPSSSLNSCCWFHFGKTALLRYILHIILFTHLKCVINPLFFSPFSGLCDHHHNLVLEHFCPHNPVAVTAPLYPL